MNYYLQLQQGKTITNPDTRVIITEGVPPTTQPVLFVQNQNNIRTNNGVRTSFYIAIYNSLQDKLEEAKEFYSQLIEIDEDTVELFNQIEVKSSQINITEIVELQLYNFLLQSGQFDNWELKSF